jgi:signal transduction histidine kinase
MTFRMKLFLYFFSISILIMITGMLFYFQSKNLIEPLTPESIPRSVEHLANVINKNALKNRLLFQQLQVEYDLENYVFTNEVLALQSYYKNNALLSQLLEQAKLVNLTQWPILELKFNAVQQLWLEILQLMQTNQIIAAKQLINNNHYKQLMEDYKNEVAIYFYSSADETNEAAVVAVKLSVKNSYQILQQSLNSTLIIFFDAIFVSIILVILSVRSVMRPLNVLRNNIEKMNIKRLEISIAPEIIKLKDEIGELARSFSKLFNKLRTTTVLRDELLIEIQRHKDTEKKLADTAARLHESNLELNQFSYAASHDLRSPLRAIETLVKWIEEDCSSLLPETSRKNLELIKKRAQRLNALITGMLEYSRIGQRGEEENVDLGTLLTEIIDTLSPPTHITVTLDTALPIIKANKTKISQVFLNLISNAIKYNDKLKGRINIGVQTVENYYQFYVKDNGCGIEPQYYETVFEIFKMLHSRDDIEGSGIGLAIVKKIVEKQGGKIWVQSTPGKETTFFFTWAKE